MKPEEARIPGGVVLQNGGYDRELALQSVKSGWAPLIHKIFDKKGELNTTARIIQVKEKWGGLRIYSDYDEVFESFIHEVERESFKVCEQCGAPGDLRSGGWYKTLCDVHGGNRPKIDMENE